MSRPIANPVLRRMWRLRNRSRLRRQLRAGFAFKGRTYRFLVAEYNQTWCNERQVELPVALQALRRAAGPRILEVGNVLTHYSRIRHRVVDKYEKHPAARNEDFLEHAEGPYDLIVSVSTFEHIGWDEPDHDATKFVTALHHARQLLAPGGRLLVTVPLGYNPAVDAFVQQPAPGFTAGFLRRTGPGPGQWEEASTVRPSNHPYGVGCANASAVAVIEAQAP